MRVTILFILTIGILALTLLSMNINPSRLEFFSGQERTFRHDQIDKINELNDVESLKAEAINQLHQLDDKVLQRDKATIKVQNLLTITIGLTIIALILLFLEIAARGKNYLQQ